MTVLRPIIVIVLLLGIGAAVLYGLWHVMSGSDVARTASSSTPGGRTLGAGGTLTTNTDKHSIPLEAVLDGGPGKDGIPALVDPKFTSIEDVDPDITDTVDGILVTVGDVAKFYPYNIMVWHEIVNDTVGGKSLIVTFCPLCGSAIVYEAEVNGKIELFGVSGKLYNSNLLMYDKTTQSLWSQVQGEAVVGDLTGASLTLYPSQVISFKTLREKYPQAHVLSTDTGYRRDYSFYPYNNYDTSSDLYFPIAITDTRLPTKEIMHVVNYSNHSIAFKVKDLKPGVVASVDVSGKRLIGKLEGGEIIITAESGEKLPGYTTMWFAWAAHHQQDGIVWTVAPE